MALKKKVLIFDDNEELLELCTLILEEVGYEIRTSANCNNVIEKVTDFKPDIIFMDNWFPQVSGVEVTQKIKAHEHLQKIPIIYFSANNNINDLAIKAGADDFLAKPFEITDLEAMVKKYS
jgi:CheY-like chemotaxis protein